MKLSSVGLIEVLSSYIGSSSGFASNDDLNEIYKRMMNDLNLNVETDEKRLK